MKGDARKALMAIRGSLYLKFHPMGKAKAIADCLENLFTAHDMHDENHEERVVARFQALLQSADNNSPENLRPCDVQKLT
jgi:hypothetical protein